MEEDKRLQTVGALAAIVALVLIVIQFAGRPSKPSTGPGWFSHVSAFGSAPYARPDQASAPAEPVLAPPERMMTNAATRMFSAPSGATSGGLAGAEPPLTEPQASMNPTRLSRSGVDLPGGGNAPTAGMGSFGSPAGGGARRAQAAGGSGGGSSPGARAGAGVGSGGGGAGASGGGFNPGAGAALGDTRASSADSVAFNSAAQASAASGGSGPKAGSMPPTEALKETPSLSGSGDGGGGGGPGGGGGGGGAGGGGLGGGMNAKPKGSGGKPEGVTAGAGSPEGGAGAGGAGGGGGAGGNIEGQGAVLTAHNGAPQLSTTTARGGSFRSRAGGLDDVPATVHLMPHGRNPISYDAPLKPIDGPSTWDHLNGELWDTKAVPFISITPEFEKAHNVQLGDCVAVTDRGTTRFAIVGHRGDALGGGSQLLISSLVGDGVDLKYVKYVVMPKSRDSDPPRDAAKIQENCKKVFDARGVPVR